MARDLAFDLDFDKQRGGHDVQWRLTSKQFTLRVTAPLSEQWMTYFL